MFLLTDWASCPKNHFPGPQNIINVYSSPWTVNVADEVIIPRIFLALHVYTPRSCDVTSLIINASRDWTIHLSSGRLEFCFSYVTWGAGFPLTSYWNEAIPVFIYHHRYQRWHNRRSWDRFTRIALGSLRALIAFRSRRPLISLRTFRPMCSLRPGRTMLAWGTRPASSSSDSFRTINCTGHFNFFPGEGFTGVWILVLQLAFLTDVCIWNVM